MASPKPLPIDAVLPEICAKLGDAGALVLQAEPGAGKTTRVPAALLDAGVAGGGSVLVLEPRRVAARAGADFVSSERGERVGEEVGYQVRFDRRGGDSTRLWFVTEGVAVRRLASDPFLEGVDVLVFDEFHERHLAADIVLAVARELQRTVRPDLKIVVMSATLDVERVAAFLGDCPVLRCPGRVFPVEVEYRDRPRERRLSECVVEAVRELAAAPNDSGSILVFLPGIAEIRRAAAELTEAGLDRRFGILTLHGDLPLEEQRRVLRASDEPRIVLSTNVAESSVTVDGVTSVVDSGLARVPELDVARGVDRLQTVPISLASADQRCGRAGRQAPGRCIRLWSRHDHSGRRRHDVPEIHRLDLTSAVLELRAWGLGELASLQWLDAPPSGALEAADRLLRELGAIDPDGAVSDVGRRMIRLPVAPRAARLAIEAARLGRADLGALAAAILSERELLLGGRAPGAFRAIGDGGSDLALRVDLFEKAAAAGFDRTTCRSLGVEAGAARAVDRARRQIRRAIESDAPSGGGEDTRADSETILLKSTLVAFSDRVVRRRDTGSRRGVMVGGTGVELVEDSCVRSAQLFVAIEARAGNRRRQAESLVSMASAVERDWLETYFEDEIEWVRRIEFDDEQERAIRVARETFRGLTLSESRSATHDGEGSAVVVQRARADPERVVALSPRGRMLLQRLDFANRCGRAVVPGGSRELLQSAVEMHGTSADGFDDLRRALNDTAIEHMLTFEQRRALERVAPESVRLPSGREAAIDYGRVGGPAVSARIQELFGLRESPRIADGSVVVAVEILGPNHRPVQLTEDLASFWETTYPQVRKELRGRYPKHDWPEDPWTATASSRVRRRR